MRRKKFDVRHSAAARLASTQLALQIAGADASVRDAPSRETGSIHDVANWQFDSLPIGTTIADGWRVDGMIESPRPWATGWHSWDVLPDGTLMVALAEAADPTARGSDERDGSARCADITHRLSTLARTIAEPGE